MDDTRMDRVTGLRLPARLIEDVQRIAAYEGNSTASVARRLLATAVAAELARLGLGRGGASDGRADGE